MVSYCRLFEMLRQLGCMWNYPYFRWTYSRKCAMECLNHWSGVCFYYIISILNVQPSVLDCVNDSNLSALFSGTEDSTLNDVRTVGDSKWRWEFPRRTTHPGKQTWNVKMDPLKIQDLGFGNHCCTSLLSRNILYINTLILIPFVLEQLQILYKSDLAPDLATSHDEQFQVGLP